MGRVSLRAAALAAGEGAPTSGPVARPQGGCIGRAVDFLEEEKTRGTRGACRGRERGVGPLPALEEEEGGRGRRKRPGRGATEKMREPASTGRRLPD